MEIRVKSVIEKEGIGFLFQAVDKRDEVVGFLTGGVNTKLGITTLDNLHVSPPYRRQGIGSRLVGLFIETAHQQESRVVGEFNPHDGADPAGVSQFYQKNGLTVVSGRIFER